MKKIFFLALSCFLLVNVNAQSISFLRDTTTLTQTLTSGSYASMQNRFTNTGVVERWYKWKMVSLISPAGWSFTICDCVACAPEGTDTASFNVLAGANCIFVYDMIHHGTPGVGIGEVKVTSLSDSTDTHTVYFVGTITDNTSIYDQMPNASIQIYPNPAQNSIHISSDNLISKGSILILNMNGQVVSSKDFENSKEQSFDIAALQAGNYMVVLKDEVNKTMITKPIVKN